MKNNKPDEILKCKHLAFSTQFRRSGNSWYLVITPNWFFSYDGYKKNFFCEDDLKWLKKKESNSHVANHLKFIAYFLKFQPQSSFFDEKKRDIQHFLNFGEFISFDNSLKLPDNDWRPTREMGDEENSIAAQEELDL